MDNTNYVMTDASIDVLRDFENRLDKFLLEKARQNAIDRGSHDDIMDCPDIEVRDVLKSIKQVLSKKLYEKIYDS